MQKGGGRRAARAAWVAAGICACVAAAPRGATHAQNITINHRHDEGPLERCDQLDITFDRRPAVRDEERLQLPAGAGPLRANVSRHGGIAVHGGPGPEHEVLVCKAVPEHDAHELPAIRAVVNGASVELVGPESPWVGYLIVRSPGRSALDVSATNGPIRADDFEGRLTITTMNGPIAIADVRGQVTARAQNGPIKLRGSGGQILLETQNGPIGVRLGGDQWQAGDLVAHAQNGPLSVSIPAAYRSGVEVESSENAPWSCRGTTACRVAIDGAFPRHARFGDGPTQVRLSTVNGPVKVSVHD